MWCVCSFSLCSRRRCAIQNEDPISESIGKKSRVKPRPPLPPAAPATPGLTGGRASFPVGGKHDEHIPQTALALGGSYLCVSNYPWVPPPTDVLSPSPPLGPMVAVVGPMEPYNEQPR